MNINRFEWSGDDAHSPENLLSDIYSKLSEFQAATLESRKLERSELFRLREENKVLSLEVTKWKELCSKLESPELLRLREENNALKAVAESEIGTFTPSFPTNVDSSIMRDDQGLAAMRESLAHAEEFHQNRREEKESELSMRIKALLDKELDKRKTSNKSIRSIDEELEAYY